MKIAMITDHLRSGGKERRMVELVKVLSKNPKYEFHLIMLEGKDETSIDYKDVLDSHVKITYLGVFSRNQLIYPLYKLCKQEKFDVLHLWAALIYGYILAPIHYALHIPIISSSITSARKQGGKKFWFNKLTYHFYDKILSNSFQALAINEVPEDKAICIYNGYDQKRSVIKTPIEIIRCRWNVNTRYIVSMAGEYSCRKDYPLFVRAANRVLAKFSDVTFIAMGAGDSSPYQSLINSDFRDRVLFVGRVTDVESVFNASDIVVLATTVEGVSNAIMEGMSLSKPIVSTFGPNVGTAEIVEEGKSGFLVPYHDDDAFAERIIKLLKNKALRISMGTRGQQIVRDKFSIEQMTASFAKIFDEYDKERHM